MKRRSKNNRKKLFIADEEIQRLWFTDSKTGDLVEVELLCGESQLSAGQKQELVKFAEFLHTRKEENS